MKSCRRNLYFLVCTCALDTYEEIDTIQDQFGEGKVKIIQVESEENFKAASLEGERSRHAGDGGTQILAPIYIGGGVAH